MSKKVNSEFVHVPEEKKSNNEFIITLKQCFKETHRLKKKLQGRKQRLRQKLQLQNPSFNLP